MYILYFQVCEKEKETEDKKPTKASKTDSAAALKTDSAAASGEFKLLLDRCCMPSADPSVAGSGEIV